jgi:MFS transporter, ACS family, glucarate transporter
VSTREDRYPDWVVPGLPRTASQVRHGVLALLCLLSFILYLDRICIGQAVSDIQSDLDISHTAMGVVLGAFTLAYGLFEIPAGHWGDRHGSRGVLTRIVLWWSAFTMLTGAATGFVMLLVVRFLFGAGEAGALPNAARVVARWYPPGARGPAQGIVVTSALVGGALAPVMAEYLIKGLGWRGAFFMLGIPGVLWAAYFYSWFRDDPACHPQVNEQELQYIRAGAGPANPAEKHPAIPWRRVLASVNIWLLGGIITCGAFTTYMIFFWYPSYLKEARGVSPTLSGWLTGMVLAAGAVGSVAGGWLSDWLVRQTGERRWSRSGLGFCSLASAALAMAVSVHLDSPWLAAGCTAWACLAIHLALPTWWAVVTEISGKHLGALFGLMNSMGLPGALGSPLFLGAFVDWLKHLGYSGRSQWDPAFYIYGGVLLVGALLWLFIDATRPVVKETGPPAEE